MMSLRVGRRNPIISSNIEQLASLLEEVICSGLTGHYNIVHVSDFLKCIIYFDFLTKTHWNIGACVNFLYKHQQKYVHSKYIEYIFFIDSFFWNTEWPFRLERVDGTLRIILKNSGVISSNIPSRRTCPSFSLICNTGGLDDSTDQKNISCDTFLTDLCMFVFRL